MQRLRLDEGNLSGEQKVLFERIAAGPRGGVEGPLRVWLTNPGLAAKAEALGEYCRYGTSLEPRLSELAIAIMGAHWRAAFEWQVHAPIGLKAGLSAAALEAVRLGRRPSFDLADEAAVYDFASELLSKSRISDETYAAARAVLGDTRLVDLVGILGYYSLISMTIKAFEIDGLPGRPDPFAEGSD